MILAVDWAKECNLVDEEFKWYEEKWLRGQVLENAQAKLIWDFAVQSTKDNNVEKTRLNTWKTRRKNHMDLRYGVPARKL